MIPADIDPSLRAGEPMPETLDDGYSPAPAAEETPPPEAAALPAQPSF